MMGESQSRMQITHTSLLGRRVTLLDNSAWSGIPPGRSVRGESGTVVSVYVDPERRAPTYTLSLSDGILIEAGGHHFRLEE